MRSERGQSTVEWIALVLLAALVLLGTLALAGRVLPGGELARAILGKIVCAVRMGGCGDRGENALALAYGGELAALVREHVPGPPLRGGDGRASRSTTAAAVSPPARTAPRPASSRARRAASAPSPSSTSSTAAPRRSRRAPRPATTARAHAAGNVYVQFFFYYPTSSTAQALPGDSGFHLDDWESFQVRLEPGGTAFVRASSHHGYNYEFSKLNAGSDAGGAIGGAVNDAVEAIGARPKGGWGPSTGQLHVSGGSHAGNAKRDHYTPGRTTPGGRLELIPIESLSAQDLAATFAEGIRPPWRKPVYSDPESEET